MRTVLSLLLITALSIAGLVYWDHLQQAQLRLQLQSLSAKLTPYGDLSWGEVRAHPWSKAEVDDLRFKPSIETGKKWAWDVDFEAKIERIRFEKMQFSGLGRPVKVQLIVTGIQWPVAHKTSIQPTEMPSLWDIGLRQLRGNGELTLNYDETRGDLDGKLQLLGQDTGSIHAALRMSGPATLLDGNWREGQLSALNIDIEAAKITAAQRDLLATRAHLSNDQLLPAIANGMKTQMSATPMRLRTTDIASLGMFFLADEPITVSFEPPGNLKLGDIALYGPEQVPAALGLSISRLSR